MNIISSLQTSARNFLGIPRGTWPTASLPVAEVALPSGPVAAPSSIRPVAAAPSRVPAFRKAPVDHEGLTGYQRKLQHEARLKLEFGLHEKLEAVMTSVTGNPYLDKSAIAARRKVMTDFDRYVAARPVGTPSAKAMPEPLDQKGTPQPNPDAEPDAEPESDNSLDSVFQQLQEVLQILKAKVTPTRDDADDEEGAKALFNRGLKASAIKQHMKVLGRVSARAAEQAAFMNLSSPDERISFKAKSIHGKLVSSMNSQESVKALTAALRPKVVPVAAGTLATDPAARIRQIDAEIAALDKLQRQRFENDRNAQHAVLAREKETLVARLHVK